MAGMASFPVVRLRLMLPEDFRENGGGRTRFAGEDDGDAGSDDGDLRFAGVELPDGLAEAAFAVPTVPTVPTSPTSPTAPTAPTAPTVPTVFLVLLMVPIPPEPSFRRRALRRTMTPVLESEADPSNMKAFISSLPLKLGDAS